MGVGSLQQQSNLAAQPVRPYSLRIEAGNLKFTLPCAAVQVGNQTIQQAAERGFTGTTGPGQQHEFAGPNGQFQMMESRGGNRGVAVGEIPESDQRFGHKAQRR